MLERLRSSEKPGNTVAYDGSYTATMMKGVTCPCCGMRELNANDTTVETSDGIAAVVCRHCHQPIWSVRKS